MTAITEQAEKNFRDWLSIVGVDTLIHDACVAEVLAQLDATMPAFLYGHDYELSMSCTRSGLPETYGFEPSDIVPPVDALAWKYADPTEDARWVTDADDLREIEAADPSLLVYVGGAK